MGTNCIKLFDMSQDVVNSMTYQDAWKFCNLIKLDLFESDSIYELRNEVAGKNHSRQLVFVNSSIQNVAQSTEKLKCYDLRSNYVSIVDCKKPFTMACYKKRRKFWAYRKTLQISSRGSFRKVYSFSIIRQIIIFLLKNLFC